MKKRLMDDLLIDMAECCKVFGDFTRMKILKELMEGEKSVSELAEKVMVSQSATSHQLRILRQAGLVSGKKMGQLTCYELNDEHVAQIFNLIKQHMEELK